MISNSATRFCISFAKLVPGCHKAIASLTQRRSPSLTTGPEKRSVTILRSTVISSAVAGRCSSPGTGAGTQTAFFLLPKSQKGIPSSKTAAATAIIAKIKVSFIGLKILLIMMFRLSVYSFLTILSTGVFPHAPQARKAFFAGSLKRTFCRPAGNDPPPGRGFSDNKNGPPPVKTVFSAYSPTVFKWRMMSVSAGGNS